MFCLKVPKEEPVTVGKAARAGHSQVTPSTYRTQRHTAPNPQILPTVTTSSSEPPPPKSSITSPDSTTSWAPNAQIHEPVGDNSQANHYTRQLAILYQLKLRTDATNVASRVLVLIKHY